MRIQPHSNAAPTLPAATTKSSRSAHAPAMKAAAPAAAPAAARPAVAAARPAAAPAAAPAPKVATEAKAAEAAAKPETYGGSGSLLDAHAGARVTRAPDGPSRLRHGVFRHGHWPGGVRCLSLRVPT
jgi:hypothetical protein